MNEEIKNMSDKDISFALYGLLLGDGYYSKEGGVIKIYHTNKQKFYCEWLFNIFNQRLRSTIKKDFIKKTTFGEIMYTQTNLWVSKRFYFETENKFFNKENKKIVSDYVLNNINKLGLLFWFLDDGQWHVSFRNNAGKRFGYLNTQSFTYEENVKIVNMFKNRFDIDLRIHTDNSGFEKYKGKIYYRIYFNATAFRKFYDLVRDYLKYIPKDFYYKFNMQYVPNRINKSLEFSQKYNLI